jgi:hypothetical protein
VHPLTVEKYRHQFGGDRRGIAPPELDEDAGLKVDHARDSSW